MRKVETIMFLSISDVLEESLSSVTQHYIPGEVDSAVKS